jgi:hypothetical protein
VGSGEARQEGSAEVVRGGPWVETHVYVRRSLRDRAPEIPVPDLAGVAEPHTIVDVDFSPRGLG